MSDERFRLIVSLLDTSACGCESHALIDHEGRCGHCGADVEVACSEGCPVGELDALQATGSLSDKDMSLVCSGGRRWDDDREVSG